MPFPLNSNRNGFVVTLKQQTLTDRGTMVIKNVIYSRRDFSIEFSIYLYQGRYYFIPLLLLLCCKITTNVRTWHEKKKKNVNRHTRVPLFAFATDQWEFRKHYADVSNLFSKEIKYLPLAFTQNVPSQ